MRVGWVGGEPKAGQRAHSDSKGSVVPSVSDMNCKGGPDCHEKQFSTPCSPINAPQDHEIDPRGFTASVKSHL